MEGDLLKQYLAYIGKNSAIEKNIENGLEFMKWKNIIKNDSIVFIKPNFTIPFYRQGVTSNPNFLRILLSILKNRCDRVIVGESDGGNKSFSADEAFQGHNMQSICKDTGAELINLTKIPAMMIEEKIQNKAVKIQLPKILINDVNCFISSSVLKVHVMTKVSLSIKNLWGCYPDPLRGLYHKNLDYKLALITKKLDPKIVLIDGSYALDGHGPMFGIPRKLDLIIASNNAVVGDSLGARIMGFSPASIGHIRISEKEKIGSSNLDNILINDDYKKFAQKFSINKTLIDRISTLTFHSEILPKLVFDSPFTRYVYKIVKYCRTDEETKIAQELKKY